MQQKGASGRQPIARPVVFTFQPTEYEVVPQNELAKWEAAMREQVGLKRGVAPAELRSSMPTWCFCGPEDPCDCEEL